MADLRTEFCGVRFKNPVLAASAEPTLSAENMKRVIEQVRADLWPKLLRTPKPCAG